MMVFNINMVPRVILFKNFEKSYITMFRFIMNVSLFGLLNIMILFVILGIGADDMFVMNDAWVQSRYIYKDKLKRMEYACTRASKAMLVTSLTTSKQQFFFHYYFLSILWSTTRFRPVLAKYHFPSNSKFFSQTVLVN
jgi:hypothetical protein